MWLLSMRKRSWSSLDSSRIFTLYSTGGLTSWCCVAPTTKLPVRKTIVTQSSVPSLYAQHTFTAINLLCYFQRVEGRYCRRGSRLGCDCDPLYQLEISSPASSIEKSRV